MLARDVEKQINDYLSIVANNSPEDRLNICAKIYQMIIKTAPDPSEVVSWFFENADFIETNNDIQPEDIYSQEDLQELKDHYGTAVNRVIEELLEENNESGLFYQRLWEEFSDTRNFDSEASRCFALYYTWIDARIPYFRISDGIKMSNREFRDLTDQLERVVAEARFIMLTSFLKSRTERASLLLEILGRYSDHRRLQSVLFAHMLSMAPNLESKDAVEISRLESKKMFAQLEKRVTELEEAVRTQANQRRREN